MRVDWLILKTFVTARQLSIQYIEFQDSYYLRAIDGAFDLECTLNKESQVTEITDFETNFKANGNKRVGVSSDSENAPIQRLKMAPAGFTYQLRCTEFESCVLGSVVNETCDGTQLNDANVKFYDAAGIEITTQAELDTNCVKTVLDWEPSYAYEVIGGTIKFMPDVVSDTRLSVIAVPDVPFAYGGSKVMVCNVNLKFVDPANGIQADGRVSKRLDPSPNHTNKLRVVINHPAGQKIKYALFVEHYKV